MSDWMKEGFRAILMQNRRAQNPASAQVEALSSVGGSVQAEGDTSKLKFAGFNLVIENPAGTIREGVDETGKAWRTEFAHAYGEITGSLGVDGDPVDVYVGPDEGATEVYIVRQMKRKQWDQFDEDKCFIGFASMEEAKMAYLNHYDDPRFFGGIIAMPIEEFRTKVYATKHAPQMIKALLFVKAHVAAHTRKLKSGKVVSVDAYSTKVVAQAKPGDTSGHPDLFAQAPAKKPHATETEAFRKWFGDSVVTDDWEQGGKPRVLYHATPHDFTEFKPGGGPREDGKWLSGPAIFLSPDPKRQPAAHNIGGYQGNFKEGTRVMPLYARIENPLYLDEFNIHEMRDRWTKDNKGEFPQWMSPTTVDHLKASGFDGIVYFRTSHDGEDQHEVIVFDANQVKSAIGNNGNFDPAHPDMTKALIVCRRD